MLVTDRKRKEQQRPQFEFCVAVRYSLVSTVDDKKNVFQNNGSMGAIKIVLYCIVEWSLTIVGHFRFQTLVTRGGHIHIFRKVVRVFLAPRGRHGPQRLRLTRRLRSRSRLRWL